LLTAAASTGPTAPPMAAWMNRHSDAEPFAKRCFHVTSPETPL
jgi:hypothetical protein